MPMLAFEAATGLPPMIKMGAFIMSTKHANYDIFALLPRVVVGSLQYSANWHVLARGKPTSLPCSRVGSMLGDQADGQSVAPGACVFRNFETPKSPSFETPVNSLGIFMIVHQWV